MKIRIYQLDYLKCVFIVFMVIFHLVYIGDKYSYVKLIVYTFHIPAFLIISGYLADVNRKGGGFTHSMMWLFIPYAIMEIGYVLMSAILPVREKVAEITFLFILEKVFTTPMGPYWYLHTLIVCYVAYYIINRICSRMNRVSFIVILGLCFWVLSEWLELLAMANAIYFIIGVIVYQSKQSFLFIFQPSVWGIIPVVMLCCHPVNLNKFSLAGILITYLIICFLLWVYRYIPPKVQHVTHFIGCNTMPILLFSPIFTIASKMMIPLFAFDASGLYFMCIAVAFVVTGSFGLAWCMDKLRISRWFCGKNSLLNHVYAVPNNLSSG